MEIHIADDIPTYSGGLGVLAGDTVRSAADLGIPLVAVRLVHRQGYVHQRPQHGRVGLGAAVARLAPLSALESGLIGSRRPPDADEQHDSPLIRVLLAFTTGHAMIPDAWFQIAVDEASRLGGFDPDLQSPLQAIARSSERIPLIVAQIARFQGRRVFAFTRPGDAERSRDRAQPGQALTGPRRGRLRTPRCAQGAQIGCCRL